MEKFENPTPEEDEKGQKSSEGKEAVAAGPGEIDESEAEQLAQMYQDFADRIGFDKTYGFSEGFNSYKVVLTHDADGIINMAVYKRGEDGTKSEMNFDGAYYKNGDFTMQMALDGQHMGGFEKSKMRRYSSYNGEVLQKQLLRFMDGVIRAIEEKERKRDEASRFEGEGL